jgi:hypothetical protein
MENSTNSSKSSNFVKSNKKVIDISFLIVILLILFTTFATAKTRVNQFNRNKKNYPLVIGLEAGLAQKKMEYTINTFNQKYIEPAYRLTLSKQLNSKLTIEFAYLNSFKNPAPNIDYIYNDQNKLISVSSIYKIKILNNISFEPKLGIGWMQYTEHLSTTENNSINNVKQSQAFQIGSKLKYQFHKNFALGAGADYIYVNNQLNFPFAYGGLYFNFTSNGINRKCPSKF